MIVSYMDEGRKLDVNACGCGEEVEIHSVTEYRVDTRRSLDSVGG